MIENLDGIYETVNFLENTNLRLYVNDKAEDYPPHWHTPFEIIMPIQNTYRAECNKRIYDLREGDIICFCPGCLHSLSAPDTGVRLIFQADTSILRGMKEIDSVISILAPVFVITPENSPNIYNEIHKLLLKIRDEYMSYSAFSEASVYSMFLRILVLVGRNYTNNEELFQTTNNKHQEYTEKFMRICDYISQNCTEELTLEDVAKIAGFSKFHFSRLFKQFTNVSFYQYLSQNRIYTAEKLLAHPEYSVTDVALKSGFTSLSSFIRMFKIVKGCTPSEFRTMYDTK